MTLEQAVNYVIKNGNKIQEGGLGTILATPAQIKKADAHFDRQARIREKTADATMKNCQKKTVGGEIRYYKNSATYAIMSRSGKILWFEIRKDGFSYSVK